MNLQLVKTENFNDLKCKFYSVEDDIWMTRKQIGEALEYPDPRKAIQKIHDRNKDRFIGKSTVVKMGTVDGKNRDVVLYNELGIFEICRYSKQPKANAFMDWAWSIIKAYRHGDLKIDNSISTVHEFLNEQKMVMKQMQENNERLYKITIKGFNQ